MLGICFEEYTSRDNGLPFVFFPSIKKTPFTCRKEQNWHEDIELQLCTAGVGTVILNGESYAFSKGDIAVANSNVIHYTGTESELTYTCIIVRADFCKQMGIDPDRITFSPFFKSDKIENYILQLDAAYRSDAPLKTARLTEQLLKILIELYEGHTEALAEHDSRALSRVKETVGYIRKNYAEHITLDMISSAVGMDKYALCRHFKRVAGQTIVEYINKYRCQRVAEYITEGHNVSEAAYLCGFENLSFFTKTFKKYMGTLPSSYKR